MPHLTLEYSANLGGLDALSALARLNQAMLDSGLFDEADIKSRAQELNLFKIGLSPELRAFAHVRCTLLAGRSDAQRKALADRLLQALRAAVDGFFPGEIQLSVETIEIDRPSYAKEVIHAP